MAKEGAQSKKEARAAATARLQAAGAALKAAAALPDPLAALPAFSRFARNGLDAGLAHHRSLSPELLDWAFGLTKANMSELYGPVWGWSDRKKRAEMGHPDARYIVAAAAPPPQPSTSAPAGAAGAAGGEAGEAGAAGAGGESVAGAAVAAVPPPPQPLAFLHYRLDLEGDEPVAYVYELQLEGAAHRRGLGRFLMQVTELMAAKMGMRRVMLTVLVANAAARGLYGALGYAEDDSSPEDDCGYMILSKRLPAPRAAPPAAAAAAPAAAKAVEAKAATAAAR